MCASNVGVSMISLQSTFSYRYRTHRFLVFGHNICQSYVRKLIRQTPPYCSVELLQTFCDGNSDRLKLAVGRTEVDISKRPRKKGRLLGLCENEEVSAGR